MKWVLKAEVEYFSSLDITRQAKTLSGFYCVKREWTSFICPEMPNFNILNYRQWKIMT